MYCEGAVKVIITNFCHQKKSQCILHRICTAASETCPLCKSFNVMLHRITNPPHPARSGHGQ